MLVDVEQLDLTEDNYLVFITNRRVQIAKYELYCYLFWDDKVG